MRTIVRSRHILDGTGTEPYQGYLEFNGPTLTNVTKGWKYGPVDDGTTVVCADDGFVMPGIHDNHVFFSGWLAANCGVDLSHAATVQEAVDIFADQLRAHPDTPVYAHGWDSNAWAEQVTRTMLDEVSATVPLLAISQDRSTYWMNTAAVERYGFTEGDAAAEKRHRLIAEMVQDKAFVNTGWNKFQHMLLSRGVVSCKDIVFDDCTVHEAIDDHQLAVTMTIEAVAHPFDPDALQRLSNRDFGSHLQFGGIKFMVDGVVADGTGDIYGEYRDGSTKPAIDYTKLEDSVAQLAERGISCCLTAEGDRAIDMSADMLAKHSNENTHHSISDLEMVTHHAALTMEQAGITAEIYPQILGLNPSLDEAYMSQTITGEDGGNFYRYTNLTEAGTAVTCGTDCPLFVTSVPQSLLRASRRRFDHGDERWFPHQAMPTLDLLDAWTHTGRGDEHHELKEGAPSTFVIFDHDLAGCSDRELGTTRVQATYVDGALVYQD